MSQVNIVGASIAGLIAGRQLAERGIETTIYEEHREIGIPEKCDGLVSSAGISELGIVPPSYTIQNSISRARFFSPSFKEVLINAEKQNVIVLDRSRFDKYLAEKAAEAGAGIELGKRVASVLQTADRVSIKTDSDTVSSELLLDCSGYESYIRGGGETFQAAQYLVYGKWFDKSTVEVYLDPESAPGFFKWVIPISADVAKIGVAGNGINTFSVMDSFVKEKEAVAFRKSAAPVICGGTVKKFVDGRIARAGDSAGQPKPTTGGGIYTGGYGGMLAGRAAAESILSKDPKRLQDYELKWKEKFGDEFRTQIYARNFFAKLTSKQLDRLVEMISSSDIPKRIGEEGDFDRHSIAIVQALGIGNIFTVLGIALSNELKSILS